MTGGIVLFDAFNAVFAALWENDMVQNIVGIVFVLGLVLCVLKICGRGRLYD